MPYRKVLAAIDVARGSQGMSTVTLNRQILELAANLAIAETAQRLLVHAWDAPAESLLRTFGSHVDDSLRGAGAQTGRLPDAGHPGGLK